VNFAEYLKRYLEAQTLNTEHENVSLYAYLEEFYKKVDSLLISHVLSVLLIYILIN
jgi:hypothetical protein